MNWIESLEKMERVQEQNLENVENSDYDTNITDLNSFDDILKAIDVQFDTLEVLLQLHDLDIDITESLKIVEDRFDEIFEKGKEYSFTDEMITNVVNKYKRMIPSKTK